MTNISSAVPRIARNRVFTACVAGMSIAITSAFSSGFAHKSSDAVPSIFLYCYPLTDISGAPFLVKAKAYGSSTIKVYADARAALSIPTVPVSAVAGVTDESKCIRASRAIDSVHIGTAPGDGLYLVAVGTHYLALPATPKKYIVHLDNRFTVKNKILQQ